MGTRPLPEPGDEEWFGNKLGIGRDSIRPRRPLTRFSAQAEGGAAGALFFCTRGSLSIAAAVGCGGAGLIRLSANAPPHRPANRAWFGGTPRRKPRAGPTRLQGASSGPLWPWPGEGLGGYLQLLVGCQRVEILRLAANRMGNVGAADADVLEQPVV